MIDSIKYSVEQMNPQPRFIVGSWLEATKLNSILSYDKTMDGKKYPLVFLDSNFETDKSETATVDLYFVARSKESYTTQQRESLVYAAILTPLFRDFLYQAFKSAKFIFENVENARDYYAEYTTDKMYYAPNVLNDIVDVLHVNLKLKLK